MNTWRNTSRELRAVVVLSTILILVGAIHILHNWGFRSGVRAACAGHYAVGVDHAGREVVVKVLNGGAK